MGIHRFFSAWLDKQRYPFYQQITETYSLFLDFNALLHTYLHKFFKNEIGEDCYTYVLKEVRKLIESLNPKLLLISVDGVAPQAKICHQRQRRFLHDTNSKFDSNQITPGTNFMIEFDMKIKEWIHTLKIEKIIYSSHLVPGEGEHKIVKLIRDGLLSLHTGKNHVIYSPDSDMIIRASLLQTPNLFIFRECEYFSVSQFRKFLSTLNISPTDFSVVVSLFGNDFLPRPIALSHVESALPRLIEIYQELKAPLCDSCGIRWDVFTNFLERLSRYEFEALSLSKDIPERFRHQLVTKFLNSTLLDHFRYQELRREWYQQGEYPAPVSHIIEDISPRAVSLSTLTDVIKSYLFGIRWTFEYYTSGQDNLDLSWYYPRLYAPMLVDLAKVAYESKFSMSKSLPLHPFEQLLMIFPPKCRKHWPPEFQKLFLSNSLPFELEAQLDVYGFYRDDYGVVSLNDDRKAEIETKAIIPFVNPRLVHDYIKSLNLSDDLTAKDIVIEHRMWLRRHPVLILTKEDLTRIENWRQQPPLL